MFIFSPKAMRFIYLFFASSRYSVNVFQPPFLPGRMSSEQPPQPLSAAKSESSAAQPSCAYLGEPQEDDRVSELLSLGSSPCHTAQTEAGDGGAQAKMCTDRHSFVSTDSGFSEQATDTLREIDAGGEKETNFEKSIKPEGWCLVSCKMRHCLILGF